MAISEKLNTQLHYQKVQKHWGRECKFDFDLIQVRVFVEDNVAFLTKDEQEMIQGAITVVDQNLEWNAAYMAQVKNFFVQNVWKINLTQANKNYVFCFQPLWILSKNLFFVGVRRK